MRDIILGEFFGTMLLILLGDGVVANVLLNKSGQKGAGPVQITFAWGLAVMIPACIFGALTGAHFNPALSIALAFNGGIEWNTVPSYIIGQMLGAFCGAILVYILFKDHYDATSDDPLTVRATFCTDKLVDLGATVVFGETTEFLGGEHILAKRAVGGENGPIGQKIYEIVDRMEKRAKSVGEDMRGGQPTPGNIAGGLSSIEEKSLGAIVKSGHRPIQGVLEYCDRVDGQKGLWIKDAPGREPEILTGMAATGAQFMMFSTGRGAPQGFPSMPVIKICGNPHTYERMQHDMDLNAGRIIQGEKTIEEVGEEAFRLMLDVLSGKMTKNEALGYYGSMDIFCLGPVI